MVTGTGFFVDRDGHVVTNNHVVKECKTITVHGAGSAGAAEVTARDKENDLALLKTSATSPSSGELRDERYPLQKDEPVVTVGFPGGRGPVTREAKIIDAKGPLGEEKWLQFTDSIARGNSGGPLLDQAGNVAGVVVAMTGKAVVNMGDLLPGKIDLAIALPVVRSFLSSNGMRWRDGTPGGILAAHRLEDRAREYIVKIDCVQN